MILNCVLPYVQLHLIEFILREFEIAAKPKFYCAITSLFPDISKSCRNRISIAIYRNYSETIPSCVLAKTGLYHTEKKFCDNSKTCPRRISIVSYRKNSKTFQMCRSRKTIDSHQIDSQTFPKCVLAEI